MKDFRIGQGLDIHQFAEGRDFILGGIKIPHNKGLKGHSDADALLHTIVDALLGACALGDIGKHFPDSDPAYKNISSSVLLEHVYKLVREKGWKIINLDATVMTEAPKLRDYIDQMRSSISNILGMDLDSCSVKATTAERLGSIGRQEGLFVSTVILLGR